MEETMLSDQLMKKTISAISKAFSEIYYIDLEQNTMQQVVSSDQQPVTDGIDKDARKRLRWMADTQVIGEFRPIMRNFMNLDTIDQRLGNQSMISQEFVSVQREWFRCSLIASDRDENGRNVSVIFWVRQISSEKEALDSQDNLIQALAIPYENIYVVNAENGEAICYRMGQTIMERYGHKFAVGNYEINMQNYIENDVLEEDRHLFDRIRLRSQVNELLSEQKTFYFNYRIFRNGEIRYYQCQLVNPGTDSHQFVLAFRNIDKEKHREDEQKRRLQRAMTELERTNATLQEEMAISEALSQEYHSLFKIDAVTGKMSLYRTDGIGMDKAMIQKLMALGSYEGAILEQYIRAFVAPEDQERIRESTSLAVLQKQVPDKGLFKIDFRRIMNGISTYYEMNTVKIADKDGKVTFIMGMRDVDDRVKKKKMQEKKLQQAYIAAEKANKAKTDFLFNMSHDIRTPMNAIIGFTDLLEKHLDDPVLMKDYIAKIKTSNEFLLALINNVLEMARIESGKEHLDETCENAYAFLKSVFLLFDSQMQQKGVRLIHSVHVQHPDVWIDETKMREILLNLLSNALKYTPAGGTVTMTLTELPSVQTEYAIYQTVIEDTGIGMSEEFLPHLFEDFSREHSSTESGVSGTGLGTAIVKKLVDLMQGKIDVTSAPGKGTKITLTIHHKIAEPKQVKPSETVTRQYDLQDFAGKRILLAEDNDLNAEIAIAILEEVGFKIERAKDGIICVDMIEKADPGYYDLILMDIQMPNMDGYKATHLIRRLPDRKKSEIPIIAMTANAFEEDRKNAFMAGMNGHIAKPIRVEELFGNMAKVMKRR